MTRGELEINLQLLHEAERLMHLTPRVTVAPINWTAAGGR